MPHHLDVICKRRPSRNKTTLGELWIGPDLVCFTLEDVVRETKIRGETCIPFGRYRMALVNSPRFGADTLTLIDVPNFVDIRVHSGNDDKDTEGCPLVGLGIVEQVDDDGGDITQSRLALDKLKKLLVNEIKNGTEVYWNIIQLC